MTFIKTGFIFVILLHGLIHILGFVKAFEIIDVPQLTQFISKKIGWLWLLTSILFIITSVNIGMNKEWSKIAIVGVILSQLLISLTWNDAKFGTIINVLILSAALIPIMMANFKNSFISDASTIVQRSNRARHNTLVNNDILHLPIPIQKYLHFVDVVGKPKVRNVKVIMEGQMRNKNDNWFSFNSIQYNTFYKKERLFFMDARVKYIPTQGYHFFKDNIAKMTVKLLSTFPVVRESGELLKKAETVTLFNDICIMAPADLISKSIQWEEVDENKVIAHFTNDGITITAKLFFDHEGALINFYSDDRIDINDKKAYGFSTPISDYKEQNGYLLPTYGEAIWHYPEGKFVYGKFNIQSITYNVKHVQK